MPQHVQYKEDMSIKPIHLSIEYSEVEDLIIEKAIQENLESLHLNRNKLSQRLTSLLNSSKPNVEKSPLISGRKRTHHRRRRGAKSGSDSRGSAFRGVSKNGTKFQVFIMINKNKRYFGVLEDEEHSALIYDKIAIMFHGMKARTNYSYSVEEVKDILDMADNCAMYKQSEY
jgi:CRISPR/Cas system-associated exonuclease Cas4 (RecB family)